jgi:predicted ATPase
MGVEMLLVFDNCEHLAHACATLAESLLQSCATLRILATSREPLRAAGEVTWRVPSLPVPPPPTGVEPDSSRQPAAGVISSFDSVRLFADRAAAASPAFVLDDANAAAVAEICRRLDGIPLAIELAAARVRAFEARQIATLLNDRFSLLSVGARTAPARHQTLRALIDWSYQQLSESEQALLRRLSVFAGGFTLDGGRRCRSRRCVAAVCPE